MMSFEHHIHHIPFDLNFDYFTANDFHLNQYIMNCLSSNSLSFLNCNIRSLQANFDNLAPVVQSWVKVTRG